MKSTRVYFATALLALATGAFAQHRLVLKFDVGKHELTDRHKQAADRFVRSIYPAIIDSAVFRGYADSLGNFDSNMELSERRAKTVMKYLRARVPAKARLRALAVGERSKRIDSIDRRVEVIVYSHDATPLEPEEEPDPFPVKDTTPVSDPGCYNTAYQVLARANTNVVKRGKTEYVMVELSYKSKILDKIYYMSGTDDLVRYTKVKWVSRMSGEQWWAKPRVQGYIPKAAYDQYKIGFLYDPPCDSCSVDFRQSGATRKKIKKVLVPDEFLFYNIQVKTALFNRRKISIRVPAQYVDPAETYYANNNIHEKIAWNKKNRKRNGKYLFSKLSISRGDNESYRFTAISKLVPCCNELECNMPRLRGSFCPKCRSFYDKPYLGAEAGYFAYGNVRTGYAGPGLFKEWEYTQAALVAGIDHRGRLHLLVRYQVNYVSFPFFAINPFSGWRTVTNGTVSSGNTFGRLYAGSELRNFRDEAGSAYTVQDLHLGFSLVSGGARLDRVFIQSGLGYAYSGSSTGRFNRTVAAGLIFRIL